LSATSMITAIEVSGTTVFAAANGDGVFVSTNNGTSWTASNMGLSSYYIWSLGINGTNIFAGTDGNGAFKRGIAEMVGIKDIAGSEDLVIYPNPGTGLLNLNFTGNTLHGETMLISVTDVMGRIILEKNAEPMNELTLDLTGQADGIYHVAVKTSDKFYQKSVVVNK
jgi:hypothetical protein